MAFPGTYNFNYYRGDTSQFVVRPKTTDGSAFDLTGYTAVFVIADVRGPTGVQTAGNAVVNATTDIVTCTITPAVGRTLSEGTYTYDVQISNGTQIYTLLTGGLSIEDDIAGAV
jgi:hypothetical protein